MQQPTTSGVSDGAKGADVEKQDGAVSSTHNRIPSMQFST